jgi:tRNA(Ile)-lysidine synthase
VSAAEAAAPVSAAEARTLFAGLKSASALVLAVSGGPDSTALMILAARWRAALRKGPHLVAVTIDHGLRAESGREARAAKTLAAQLGIRHRTMRWTGDKPATGLQEAARGVRYRLRAAAARTAGARHVLTAHTLDDQAETVLLRMARGSGLTGLGAMARETVLEHFQEKWNPVFRPKMRQRKNARAVSVSGLCESALADPTERRHAAAPLLLVRPLLELPKARLIATLVASRIAYCEDPSNVDPRFTRARWREVMPVLAGEGLDARRLALLARRLRRAEAAIEFSVAVAAVAVSQAVWPDGAPIVLDAEKFIRLPEEVALRVLGRAIVHAAGELPLRLGRLEALYGLLAQPNSASDSAPPHRVRRTLAGALITLAGGRLTVERAPPRSKPASLGTARP